MQKLNKTLIATGIALTLSGGAAAAALAPSGSGTTPITSAAGGAPAGTFSEKGPFGGDLLAAAATYLGITPAALRTQLRAGSSLADVAVAQGKTRDGLIAALTTAAATRIGTIVDLKGLPGGRGEAGELRKGGIALAAATYLGITPAELQTKVAAGQTPAAIATATSGKSRDGLIAAIVADGKAKIDAAQAAGTMTAAKATEELAELTEHATRFADSLRQGRHR